MDEDQLFLRPADPPSPADLYAIRDDLDFTKRWIVRLPTRSDVWRAAMLGMLGGRLPRRR